MRSNSNYDPTGRRITRPEAECPQCRDVDVTKLPRTFKQLLLLIIKRHRERYFSCNSCGHVWLARKRKPRRKIDWLRPW